MKKPYTLTPASLLQSLDLNEGHRMRPIQAAVGPLRRGDTCPRCGQACLDYDSTLSLACVQCGYQSGGCFT